VTPQEAADYLRIKIGTLRKYTRLGIIPKAKLLGAVRYDLEKVHAWLEERSQQGLPTNKVSAYEINPRLA
jgi:excisionase family DNA binding protein